MSGGLHWIDVSIVTVYAGGMLGLGWYYSRKKMSADEYFTGGRNMSPVLVGISLFATLLSTISYLARPGEIVKNGPYILTSVFSIPVAFLVVGYLLVPLFMRYRLTSAYELLEQKLGFSSRLIGAGMFVTLRLMWMSVLLNFAAGALLVMLGLEDQWLFPATAAIGLIAVVYSTLGGLRAVVVTDMIQFVLLMGGALLVVIVVTIRLGGFTWIPTGWDANWQVQPVFSLDPFVRLTVVGVILTQTLWTICTAGSDQTAIQRYMATRDARSARKSYLVNSIASIAASLVLSLVGLALMAYFRTYPGHLPAGETVFGSADRLFPYFISHHLPTGLSGLVVAGMFAAAMSSVDSGVNSITAVVTTDFLGRSRTEHVTPVPENAVGNRREIRTARLIAGLVGILVIGGSTLVEYVPGNLLAVSKRATDLLVTPLFTLFFMALFVRFATPAGANIGSICAFLTAALIAFWNPLFDQERSVSFTWISPAALAVGISSGCVASLLTGSRRCVTQKQQ